MIVRSQTLSELIQGLYDGNVREQDMDADARVAHRKKFALPLLDAIKKYVDSLDESNVLPKSDMAGALGYIRNHWEALSVYVSNGQIPIDNNRVEQLMRQVALGRKNWLFVANVESGERVARLMSIVSSAKRHSLDVWKYLKDVLDRVLAGRYGLFENDARRLEARASRGGPCISGRGESLQSGPKTRNSGPQDRCSEA